MRGKVTDQDLTDYALNELQPDERLYVESMLAVSEECRGDVYQMLELGEMLKEGFEADERMDETGSELLLNAEQRAKVLEVPAWNFSSFVRKIAAVLVLSAGTAFIMSRPGVWGVGGAVDKLAEAGDAVKSLVGDLSEKGVARNAQEFIDRIKASAQTASTVEEWQFVATPAVCTPPAWSDVPLAADVVEM